MKDWVLTIIFSLLFGFTAFQTTSDDNGIHKGWVIGEGHDIGNGQGHDNHLCNPDCPYCGGNPCIPPCDGTGGGGGGF